MLKLIDVFRRSEASALTQLKAAELLSIGSRASTVRAGIIKRKADCPARSSDQQGIDRRVPVDRCEEVEHYRRALGFTARHFHGACSGPPVRVDYSWTKAFLQTEICPEGRHRGAPSQAATSSVPGSCCANASRRVAVRRTGA